MVADELSELVKLNIHKNKVDQATPSVKWLPRYCTHFLLGEFLQSVFAFYVFAFYVMCSQHGTVSLITGK
jgi:hypothetical protein